MYNNYHPMERKTDINFPHPRLPYPCSHPSCSEPFPIVLYTSFKIYLSLSNSQRTHSSFINIVSTPRLQTGTFYDDDQLLELSRKKFQLLVNTGFLVASSLLGLDPYSEGRRNQWGRLLFHCSWLLFRFTLFCPWGDSAGRTTSVADLNSG